MKKLLELIKILAKYSKVDDLKDIFFEADGCLYFVNIKWTNMKENEVKKIKELGAELDNNGFIYIFIYADSLYYK
jgi:hypothetical protein